MKFIAKDLEEMKKIEEVLAEHGLADEESRKLYDTAEISFPDRVELKIIHGFSHTRFYFPKKWNLLKMWMKRDEDKKQEYTITFLFENLFVRVEHFTNIDNFEVETWFEK